jgi:hypothetical protein
MVSVVSSRLQIEFEHKIKHLLLTYTPYLLPLLGLAGLKDKGSN